MELKNIGVVSPGDMGQAVAVRLKGMRLRHLYSAGRPQRAHACPCRQGGSEDCGTMSALVSRCDMVCSILNPARRWRKRARRPRRSPQTGKRITYVDCNAVAPETVREIDRIIPRAARRTSSMRASSAPRPSGAARTACTCPPGGAPDDGGQERPFARARGERARRRRFRAQDVLRRPSPKGRGGSRRRAPYRRAQAWVWGKRSSVNFRKHSRNLRLDTLAQRPHAAQGVSLGARDERDRKDLEDAGMTPRMLLGAADMFEMIAGTALGKESARARARARPGCAGNHPQPRRRSVDDEQSGENGCRAPARCGCDGDRGRPATSSDTLAACMGKAIAQAQLLPGRIPRPSGRR